MNAPYLKPCPFCGGSNIRFDLHRGAGRGEHYGDDVWSMCCYECGASTPNRYNEKGKALMVAAWNRRADLPPKVRALEWVELSPNHMMAALPLFGNIRVESWGGPFQVVWSVPGICNTFTEGKWPTAEAAKAAAQADYEARILAALVQP